MFEPHAHMQPLSLLLAVAFALVVTALFLLARLASSSKCSPKSHPRLAAGRVYVWPRLSLDCRGVPPSHT